MYKKIVGMLVITLLITTIYPIVGSIEINKMLSPGVIDQEQSNVNHVHWLEGGVPHWQQFRNRGNKLEKVDLHIGCWFSGSYPITLSIEETFGVPLTYVTYQAADFPLDAQTWFTFDVPDVKLSRDKTYFIVLSFDPGSEYAWSGDYGNPYPNGISSHTATDWDYAFRTIVDKSKTRAVNTPFLHFLHNFLCSHPNMFPILQKLIL